jgi:hypothetical protein
MTRSTSAPVLVVTLFWVGAALLLFTLASHLTGALPSAGLVATSFAFVVAILLTPAYHHRSIGNGGPQLLADFDPTTPR